MRLLSYSSLALRELLDLLYKVRRELVDGLSTISRFLCPLSD